MYIQHLDILFSYNDFDNIYKIKNYCQYIFSNEHVRPLGTNNVLMSNKEKKKKKKTKHFVST